MMHRKNIRKERAIKLQDQGNTKEALKILTKIYQKEKTGTHGFAMMSMGLSRAYRLVGEHEFGRKVSYISCYDRYKTGSERK